VAATPLVLAKILENQVFHDFLVSQMVIFVFGHAAGRKRKIVIFRVFQ